MVRRAILETGRFRPVESSHNGRPGRHRGQFFLAHIVIEAAAVLADTTAQHQRDDAGPVDQVGMVPVVDPGADNDRTFALGLLGGGGPFTGKLDNIGPVDTGVFFLPGRGIGAVFLIVVLRIVSRQLAVNTELGHQQVIDCGNRDPAGGGLQVADRNSTLDGFTVGKIVKRDLNHFIGAFQQ